MRKIKALLTDLDGTLIHSVDPICDALLVCFRYVGALVPEKQQIIDMFGLPVEQMLMQLGGVSADETERIDSFIAEYKRQYPIFMEHAAILPGVESTLSAFYAAGVKICLITNERRQNAAHILNTLGLSRYIKYMVTRDDVSRFKPDPQPLHLAVKQVGESIADCAYIGEAPYDIQAGTASGVYTIAVPSGTWSVESLEACFPDHIVGDFSGLLDHLTPVVVEE